jgi:hypothetical protein
MKGYYDPFPKRGAVSTVSRWRKGSASALRSHIHSKQARERPSSAKKSEEIHRPDRSYPNGGGRSAAKSHKQTDLVAPVNQNRQSITGSGGGRFM